MLTPALSCSGKLSGSRLLDGAGGVEHARPRRSAASRRRRARPSRTGPCARRSSARRCRARCRSPCPGRTSARGCRARCAPSPPSRRPPAPPISSSGFSSPPSTKLGIRKPSKPETSAPAPVEKSSASCWVSCSSWPANSLSVTRDVLALGLHLLGEAGDDALLDPVGGVAVHAALDAAAGDGEIGGEGGRGEQGRGGERGSERARAAVHGEFLRSMAPGWSGDRSGGHDAAGSRP